MRIIAGSLRGREIGPVPEGVRPTTDRVRESLFSALGDVSGLKVLDLFAGTGALGLESYSRGASEVVFVDRSRRVLRALQRRIERLGLDEAEELRLVPGEADRALRRLAAEKVVFDLVFVDPPYADRLPEPLLGSLFAGPLLSREAVVVVERSKRHPVPSIPGSRQCEERRYGETILTWLVSAGAAPEEE